MTEGIMAGGFRERVVLVTGASRGIGAATARAFGRAGATVVLSARDERALEAVAEEVRGEGGKAVVVPADVADQSAVERVVETAVDSCGRLDYAFNNAAGGGHRPAPLAEVPVDAFDSALAVSLRGIFLSMKYEIPAILTSGGGAIVNMSSTAGLRGVPGVGAYVASKHGVIGLTKSAALDYADRGIRINAVAPGPILTHRLAALDPPVRERLEGQVPMRRLGKPEEVASVVLWLCSDAAGFVNGATFTIDGGRLAAGA